MGGITTTLFQRPRDPQFNNTTLLLSGNFPTNGAQNNTFLDSSSNGFSITRNGNTTQGTLSPFSQTGWSGYMNSSGASISTIFLNGESDFAFGTGDFTIEFWLYLNPTGTNQVVYDQRPATVNGAYTTIYLDNSVTKLKYYANTADQITQTGTFTYNTWHHVVVTRTGTSTKMFINGTQQGSTYTDTTNYLNGANRPCTTNGFNNSDGALGYISNLRIVKGSGPYQSAGSTITVPTSSLMPVTNTVLLTLQSNRFVDTNTQVAAKTVNVSNNPSIQPFSPFVPSGAYTTTAVGGSGYFDGSGDFLTCPTGQTPLLLGNSDFTIEAWVYRASGTGTGVIFIGQSDLTTAGGSSYVFYVSSTATSEVYIGASSFAVTSPNPTVGQWAHVAFVRTGGTLSTYLNGSRVGTRSDLGTSSVNNGSTANSGAIGAFPNGTNALNGYISGLRLIKGAGGYNATQTSITIPTEPLTNITNTSLLCNFTNAGIFDSTAKNVLETVGNAQISTAVSRFGGTSMYFDGTGDRLIAPNSQNTAFGTGDFTVEMWVYPNSFSTSPVLFDTRNVSTNTAAIALTFNTSGNPRVYVNGGFLITGSSAASSSAWSHLAMVKSSGTITLYLNGTSVGSSASSTSLTDTGLTIGDSVNTAGAFNGYIDDLRITKGVARYTANFNVPTIGFTDR